MPLSPSSALGWNRQGESRGVAANGRDGSTGGSDRGTRCLEAVSPHADLDRVRLEREGAGLLRLGRFVAAGCQRHRQEEEAQVPHHGSTLRRYLITPFWYMGE